MPDSHFNIQEIKKLIVFAAVRLLAITLAFLAIWLAWKILLLAFAGLRLAIILDSFTEWVQHTMHVSRKLAYLAVLAPIFVVCSLTAWLLIPRVIEQAGQIAAVIPKSIAQVRGFLNRSEWGHYVIQTAERESSSNLGPRVTATAPTSLTPLQEQFWFLFWASMER